MKGVIVNYRQSVHHQKGNQMIIEPEGVTSGDDASELVGKQVSWKSGAGKEITGTVQAIHGRKGAVRALFEKGLPGQSVGTAVEIR